MTKHSRRYQEAAKLVDPKKIYTVKEAVELIKSVPKTKFDESVDIAIKLNADSKKADQMIRGTVVLPHGTGKKVRVAVFCKGESEAEAREAGADFLGADDLINKVAGGWLDFDCAIATPDMMKDLSKVGKILGPRGLMPSPKTGTVTKNVAQAIKEAKAGKVEFKIDKQSDVHVSIGKVSFAAGAILENLNVLMEALKAARPVSIKGDFIKSVSLCSTMGPGIRVAA